MVIDGFLAVTAVLEPHRLFLPAAVPVSGSPAPPSVVAGDVLVLVKDILRAAKALVVVLCKDRETEREHTETPGVWGGMRTKSLDPNRHQHKGGETGKLEEGWGQGVKVTETWRLQLYHNKEMVLSQYRETPDTFSPLLTDIKTNHYTSSLCVCV